MPEKKEFDVIVIGGGPGGSMVSTLLADGGKSVLTLEAARFPRYHIGESLLLGTVDLLDKIGIREQLEAGGFIKKYGVEWVWGEHREPWTVDFRNAVSVNHHHTYQVERAPFDKMLLDNAREHGVDVREQHKVTDFSIDANGRCTVHYRRTDTGETGTATARWLVDASGQGGTVTKRLHTQEWDPYLKNMAVWSYWKGVTRHEGENAGNIFLPTFDDGWWWCIPLRDDVTSIGAVVDRESFSSLKSKDVKQYYLDSFARTPELAARMKNAEQVDEMHVQRDWSYIYDRFSGDGYLAIGDAACFIDPLFSTGVHLAMLSGFIAATVVNTVLDKPELDRARMLQFYEDTYRKEFSRLRDQVYFLYAGNKGSKESYFWHARNHFGVPSIEPEKAFVSLIAGAFAHRAWYNHYAQHLDVPDDLKKSVRSMSDEDGAHLDVPLIASAGGSVVDDFAIDGRHLREARSLVHTSGASIACTPTVMAAVEHADGKRTGREIIALITDRGIDSEERARSTVHEVISHGFVEPKV
ncbi:FAD-dependent oxidoreductase [Streptomyces flavofungini]|uniref:FAD-dependent oxidoreductase n=1 Tax=Streptomyces flavofungini TaxID=68200 RepID=UPI0034DFF5E0